ncbi:MAG: hypothetical protein QY311_01905 [Candidatus Paceibacterota bacterium]|nr:MAG: hypothetical protein QY311_01905 [Candidatus Paceibacterota bacterium]
MSFIQDIQGQPQHVRELIFFLAVVLTVALVGALWFRGFRSDMYALLHPPVATDAPAVAQESPALVGDGATGGLANMLASLRANLASLFGFSTAGEREEEVETNAPVYTFPTTPDRSLRSQ